MNTQNQEVLTPSEYEREVPTVLDASAVAVVARQEIDSQIATAHRFPRSIKAVINDVTDMATRSEGTALECSYAVPREGKTIEGPSVRFAEILLSAWGNCRSAARIVGDDGSFITAQGMFHDLQKNSAVVFEVRRRITNKHGKRYSDDMIGVAGAAACAIALRNAILRGIPKALWIESWEQARKTAKGTHKTLPNRRAEAVKLFQGYGVTVEQLTAFFGVAGIEEINSDQLLQMRGMVTAFRDGDTTPESVFGDPQAKAKAAPKPIGERLDAFAEAGEQSESAAAETPDSASSGEAAASSEAVNLAPAEEGAAVDTDPKLKDAADRGRAARASGMDRALPKNLTGKAKEAEAKAFLAAWDKQDDLETGGR